MKYFSFSLNLHYIKNKRGKDEGTWPCPFIANLEKLDRAMVKIGETNFVDDKSKIDANASPHPLGLYISYMIKTQRFRDNIFLKAQQYFHLSRR